MAKSSASKLYGAKGPRLYSQDGELQAREWAQLRAPGAWGEMKDGDQVLVIWFNDPGARDEFLRLFGGVSVTLHRREEITLHGDAAVNFLRKAG